METAAFPTTIDGPHPCPASRPAARPGTPGILGVLAIWMILTAGLEGALWRSGVRQLALSEAVEQGADQVERRTFGEVSEDQVRKAIRAQYATLPFWTTLALLDDYLVEPMAIVARPLAVATLLTTLAALVGRPARFGEALGICATAQGLWVLGLAVRVALTTAVGLDQPETSLALALAPGPRSALALQAARQVDLFAICGWMAMALGSWRRARANLVVALLVCALVALVEAAVRINVALLVGAGMRLTLIPAYLVVL